MKVLSGELTSSIPLYCTGYPDSEFISRYKTQYPLTSNDNELYLNDLDYSLISSMGFDAISLWDFRRGKGGYKISDDIYVDGWGRKKGKDNWYLWDGIFKSKPIIDSWKHLNLPSRKNLENLSKFLHKAKNTIDLVLSLPGLFEKTWQSMGLVFFSKMLKKNRGFIEYVTDFFLNYLKKLISELLKTGIELFLIADDCGYKNRSFIPTSVWKQLFFGSYRKIVTLIHEGKGKILFHSDGYITDLIPIIIDLGFDGIQSLEPSAGVDIFQLFKQFSGKICYIGNLDMTLLSFGTQADVKVYVENLINVSRKFHAPLIISPTQQLDKSCKSENVKMMIDCTKKFKLDQAHL
jgi:hypothetical protein